MPHEELSQVQVPLDDWVEQIAVKAAQTVIEKHTSVCPIAKVDERLRVLETRFNLLLGAILGSGVLGGATGAAILKVLGG